MVHPEALRNWVCQAEADAGERHDRPTTDMLAENRRLAAENAELGRVNEVLPAPPTPIVEDMRNDGADMLRVFIMMLLTIIPTGVTVSRVNDRYSTSQTSRGSTQGRQQLHQATADRVGEPSFGSGAGAQARITGELGEDAHAERFCESAAAALPNT